MECTQCGEILKTYSGRGRPQTKFCSRRCQEASRTAVNRARVDAERAARWCVNCGDPLPPGGSGKAITCSAKCGIAWQNKRKVQKKQAIRAAKTCANEICGRLIPLARKRAKFCSTRCQRTTATMLAYQRGMNLNRLYGITPDEYESLLASQDGRCAICRTDNWTGKGPHVDHCHETGAVRGILCHKCNLGLGKFDDDPERLRAAARYLETI